MTLHHGNGVLQCGCGVVGHIIFVDRKQRGKCLFFCAFYFIQALIPFHSMVWPTFRVSLPTSVSIESPSQTFSKVCLLGGSVSFMLAVLIIISNKGC